MNLLTNQGGHRTRLPIMTALVLLAAGCGTDNPGYEYIRLPGTDQASGANLPFTSALKVRSGNIVFLSGITAAPVPHSHPHIPSEFDHLDFSAAAQTERIMERMRQTIVAAGGDLSDIVQVTRFMVDIDANQDAVNTVMNRFWGEHRPASTSVEIVRLATDPRFVLEIEAIAVVPE